MTLRYQRARNVLWVAESLRERHPVLNVPVRRLALRHVLAEEGIIAARAAIRARAYVDGANGSFIITVRNDLDGQRLTKVLLHEYAHIHLHMEEHEGVTRQLFPCRPGDVREAEADLLAALLWFGEDITPDYAPIAKLMAAVDAQRLVRPLPAQQELPLPAGVPMYKHPAGPAFDQSHGSYNGSAQWAPRRPRDRYKAPRLKLGDSHDSLLFDWSRKGKPLGYFHLQKGWCDIWDSMGDRVLDGRTEILECGDRRAHRRDFVFSSTERYYYVFKENEKRGRSPKELNAQLERANRLVVNAPIGAALLFRARKEDA